MVINLEKIQDFLERVTAGGAGEVVANFNSEDGSCTITWKRPRGVSGHESYKSRAEIMLHVKDLLVNAGVEVRIEVDITQEDFLPED